MKETKMQYTEAAKEIISLLPSIKGSFRRVSVTKVSHGECHMLGRLHWNGGSMMAGELAKCAGVTTARMTVMLKGTEEKGWTRREAVEEDRRKTRVVLTEAGEALVVKMYQEAIQNTAEYLEALGPEDTEHLLRILQKTKRLQMEEK